MNRRHAYSILANGKVKGMTFEGHGEDTAITAEFEFPTLEEFNKFKNRAMDLGDRFDCWTPEREKETI